MARAAPVILIAFIPLRFFRKWHCAMRKRSALGGFFHPFHDEAAIHRFQERPETGT
jgi:hypothetical protein